MTVNNTDKIYEIYLHEEIMTDSGMSVTRVPGGWIYCMLGSNPIFVPYNNEFQDD